MFILSIFVFFDCMQCIGVGLIRALGKQGIASIATAFGYWIVGIPISIIFVHVYDHGLVGLWYGPTTAILLNFFLYFFIVIKCDWQEEALRARERR